MDCIADARAGEALAPWDKAARDGRSSRLGIMGGTFDPIHFGHLACAAQAREALELDGVLFMPAGNPAFKQNRAVTPAADRVALCRLAVADNPAFAVSTLEVDRPGVTYAVDTLRQLRDAYPASTELVFIAGADSIATLPRWRDADRLARLCCFAAATRPGYELSPSLMDDLGAWGFMVTPFQVTPLDISSSMLRQRAEQGATLRYLAPDAVCVYIDEHGLYRKDVV